MGYLAHTGRKRLERNTKTAYLLKFIKISTKVVFRCVLITYYTNNISHHFPILFSFPRLSAGFLKYKNTSKYTCIIKHSLRFTSESEFTLEHTATDILLHIVLENYQKFPKFLCSIPLICL